MAVKLSQELDVRSDGHDCRIRSRRAVPKVEANKNPAPLSKDNDVGVNVAVVTSGDSEEIG